MLVFVEEENRRIWRKTLGAVTGTNNKLNPHVMPGPWIKPGHSSGRWALSPLHHPCSLCTVMWIFWLKSSSWPRTISAEAWSSTPMRSNRLLTVGEETGWSNALAAKKREIVDLTSLTRYFSWETIVSVDHILQRSNANWMKVEMHNQA